MAPLATHPELNLLFACGQLSPELEQVRALASKDIDWERVAQTAEFHGLSPLLLRTLRAAGISLPSDVATKMEHWNAATVRQNLYLTSELLRVHAALKERGIETIPLKGPALASQIYGDLGLRPFSDIDLLVRREQRPEAESAIKELGYEPEFAIPPEHREVFYSSSRDGGRLLDPVPLTPAEIEQGNAGNLMAQMYFQQLFELRRKSPGDDLTTQLVQAEEDGSKLSNEELTANIILLFGAGHETTVNLIGNGLLALHRNPDQLALLKANPALITNAIEEFLRYDSSVQMTGRVALEEIDDLGGKKIPKGESVLCLLGSANRDPAVYPDRPERLDITRPNVRPLSFGGGIHFCLGAQLARIEAEVAIATLLRRLPDLRLDDAENPEWRPTFVLRGLKRLPASW